MNNRHDTEAIHYTNANLNFQKSSNNTKQLPKNEAHYYISYDTKITSQHAGQLFLVRLKISTQITQT
ncbi:MAG: hypothetical protein LBJ00_05335 [Planctomycetaceae bacterium]|nr:hypothetical protein [Planctomycetaceae bacterium]